MSRSIKFKNSTYIDCSGIVYGHTILSSLLDSLSKGGTGTWDNEGSKEKTFSLIGFSTYIFATGEVGAGNLYGYNVYIIMTGQDATKQGQIAKIVDKHSGISLAFTDGLHIKATWPTVYHFSTLYKLNIRN